MVVKIELESLDDLKQICECIELCINTDKIHLYNREQVRKIAEMLRNTLENYKDTEREII